MKSNYDIFHSFTSKCRFLQKLSINWYIFWCFLQYTMAFSPEITLKYNLSSKLIVRNPLSFVSFWQRDVMYISAIEENNVFIHHVAMKGSVIFNIISFLIWNNVIPNKVNNIESKYFRNLKNFPFFILYSLKNTVYYVPQMLSKITQNNYAGKWNYAWSVLLDAALVQSSI